jgi:hypothetical protein
LTVHQAGPSKLGRQAINRIVIFTSLYRTKTFRLLFRNDPTMLPTFFGVEGPY